MGNNQCCERDDNEEYKSQLKTVQLTNRKNEPQQKTAKKISSQIVDKQSKIEADNSRIQTKRQQEEIHNRDNKLDIEIVYAEPQIPKLSSKIQERLQNYKYFQQRFNFVPEVKKFGAEIYQGQLSKESKKPEGYGKMYKSDGSLYIGQFHRGKAEGRGVYLMPDGSFYNGNFHVNSADGNGMLWTQSLQYQGNFKKNIFHGKGEQRAKTYEFIGQYYQGNKTQGVLKWKNDQDKSFVYTGHFNFTNQFHGTGILEDPCGTYSGDFKDGEKHGKGIYKFKNGLRYEGDYSHNKKKGNGTLYNHGNTIAYQGEFDDDLPHGIGYIYDTQKGKVQVKWVYGIDSTLL